jgi:predicted dehydrogenase
MNSATYRGIGQVGLGGITVHHREGYRRLGLPVVAGFDPEPRARERLLGDTPSATAFDSLDALLADERVEVIDFAVPHHRELRSAVLKRVADAGKPTLIQKPLGMTYEDAHEYAKMFEKSGTPAMVNQNMCFTPGALEFENALLREHTIGQPFLARLTAQFLFDTSDHSWFGRDERWWTVGVSVHHFGLLQLIFGPPSSVYAVLGRDKAQPGVLHEGYGNVAFRYANGLHVLLDSTGTYYGVDEVRHTDERVWIQGTKGIIDWHPDRSYTVSRRSTSGPGIESATSDAPVGTWFPDAFGLAMEHFQSALAAGKEPRCSISDNEYVMAAIEAAYISSAENRVVTLSEIMGDDFDPSYGTGWEHGFVDWVAPSTEERS